MEINKKYGICFWITGLAGSGKSSIGKLIQKDIEKKYGKTLLIHGDDIRNIFNLKGYKKNYRLKIGKSYSDFCKLTTKQGINIIFTTIGLIHELQEYNRSNVKNFIEIYIKSNMTTLLKRKQKIFYIHKTSLVYGVDVKPEYPKNPDIIINNNFKKSSKQHSSIILKKLKEKVIQF